jgi:uncharacterized membrane protein
MNKKEFIETLRYYLVSLPEDERNELLRDYEAHFIHGLQSGKTELEIARELGEPSALAREAVGAELLPPPLWAHPRKDIPRFIGVSILLFFLNVLLAIPVFASLWAGFISICASAIAGILSPLAFILDFAFYGDFMPAKLFIAIGMIGIGMLLAALARYIGKGLLFITTKYGKWNHKTWRGTN